MVREPERFDVVATENMFGDILSDLGGTTSCSEMAEAVIKQL